jgi:alpha-tubulin suppressor-like RCC1 family protein
MGRPLTLSCGASHTVVSTDNGDAYSWGDGFYGALGIKKSEN